MSLSHVTVSRNVTVIGHNDEYNVTVDCHCDVHVINEMSRRVTDFAFSKFILSAMEILWEGGKP
eukprot:437655-Amorphochlora_amoeboformis.AAC.1